MQTQTTPTTSATIWLALGIILVPLLASRCEASNPNLALLEAKYATGGVETLAMNMSATTDVEVTLVFNQTHTKLLESQSVRVKFSTSTLSPQFNILSIVNGTDMVKFTRKQLQDKKFVWTTTLRLHADYIGHATLAPTSVELVGERWVAGSSLRNFTLNVTIIQYEGIWGSVFIISVSALIVISYINLGAQLDRDNLQQIVKRPKTIILGFIVSVVLMPAISWFIGLWLFGDQLLYRIGSFVFACCPAASASTLWTVMLDADKELSVGLQVASTIGALISMPLLLYFMDTSMNLDTAHHTIKVPYARLIQTLFVLLVALFVGWRFVGSHEKAQKISQRIFRPLTFSVLIFIIIFSSIVYWYIYQMFDWTIALASFLITATTYLISWLLGSSISCNMDHAVAISISSTYKNSGIAFAVLLVAFGPPDTYIAYVPCLTQVVTTSITLYLIYSLVSLVNYIKRRHQPDAIQATDGSSPASAADADQPTDSRPRLERLGSDRSEPTDEFIAMNVTDVLQDTAAKQCQDSTPEENSKLDSDDHVEVAIVKSS